MAYHTNVYLFLFLPAALVTYQLAPRKRRWMVLLGYSYLFFFVFSKKLILCLIGTTLLIHYVGIWLSQLKQSCRREQSEHQDIEKAAIRRKYRKWERCMLAGGILALLAVLAYLKYYNFFAQNMNVMLEEAGKQAVLPVRSLVLPIGISFYTLQAIGYMADVYWEKIPAELHLGKLALFLGFFPQLMEGPICRYSDTADALMMGEPISDKNLTQGCMRILWGLFKKMIIADRLSVLVGGVFDHYESYGGIVVAVAAAAYTVQLYMEFSGCMDIVLGSGKIFGICLPENFRQPFASRNPAEFWRRWHITLGTWLKTYIFYPVSVSGAVKKWNQFGRKHLGKYGTKIGTTILVLFPVWLGNGLWHGARWSYLFYGMYYFVLLVLSTAVEPVRNRLVKVFQIREDARYWRGLQIGKIWIIILVGEMFFRANGLKAGIHMFLSIFRQMELEKLWDGTLLGFGLDRGDFLVILAGCVIVGMVGKYKEKNKTGLSEKVERLPLPGRWLVYYSLLLAVVILGAYGEGYQQVDLIYAGF